MTIGIFKEWLVKYFFVHVHKIVFKAILVFWYTLDYLATFVVSKMASSVFVWSNNKVNIRNGNEYKIRKWLVLNFMVLAIYQIILHLNKITECLKMTTFKIVFTFDVFVSAETTMHCKVTCILYKKHTFQSALLFTSTISDPMTVTW